MSNSKKEERIFDDQIEGRNSVLELLESGKDINKIFVARGEKHGSINKIIGTPCKAASEGRHNDLVALLESAVLLHLRKEDRNGCRRCVTCVLDIHGESLKGYVKLLSRSLDDPLICLMEYEVIYLIHLKAVLLGELLDKSGNLRNNESEDFSSVHEHEG